MEDPAGKSPPGEILRLFLRLGLTAFGGPAAHIGLMQREAVELRGWMDRARFLDLVGACNLLPGPSSTQVAMALGYTRAGWLGLFIAGACFILPASLATLALAWSYVRFGSLPQAQGLLYGAKPVMVAIVVAAIWNLGRLAFRGWGLAVAGLLCFAAVFVGAPAIAILLASGSLMLLAAWGRSRPASTLSLAALPIGQQDVLDAQPIAQPDVVPLAGAAAIVAILPRRIRPAEQAVFRMEHRRMTTGHDFEPLCRNGRRKIEQSLRTQIVSRRHSSSPLGVKPFD